MESLRRSLLHNTHSRPPITILHPKNTNSSPFVLTTWHELPRRQFPHDLLLVVGDLFTDCRVDMDFVEYRAGHGVSWCL